MLQWLLVLTAAVGLGWTVLLVVSGTLGDDSTPKAAGIALPLVLLLGGILLGLLLALGCRFLVAATARRRAAVADKRLRAAVHEVAGELVVAPVEAELLAYTVVRNGLVAALA